MGQNEGNGTWRFGIQVTRNATDAKKQKQKQNKTKTQQQQQHCKPTLASKR